MPDDDQSTRGSVAHEEDRAVVVEPSSPAAPNPRPSSNARPSVPASTDRPPRQRRALVVEDNAGIRNLLTRALEIDGYDVVTAVDGIDGWQRMNEAPAALVITDFLLPRLDGLDFARRVRAAYGTTTKIVVVSSLSAAEHRVVADHVADAFLPKTVDVGHFLRVVAALWD